MINQSDLDHIFKHTQGLWEPLRDKTLFLTGGTGFVGKWLLESLIDVNRRLNLNCKVTVLSRHPERFSYECPHLAGSEWVEMLCGDVSSFELAEDEKFDFIIHAATDVSDPVQASNDLAVFSANVDGTRRVLDLAVHSKSKAVLLTSSGAVYGVQPPELKGLSESSPCQYDFSEMLSAYAMGKCTSEWLARVYSREFSVPCKIARCFAFVGPYLPLDKHFAIGNFMRDILRGREIKILGDGTPYRSYLYAADLAIWLWTILLKGEVGEAYNVGSDDSISIEALAHRVVELSASKVSVNVLQKPKEHALSSRYIPDISKARKGLDLDVYIGLDDSILRTVSWNNGSSLKRKH